MIKPNKMFIVFIILLLFTLLTSYNIYKWQYYKDINYIETSLTQDIKELRALVLEGNLTLNETVERLDSIQYYVMFQQRLFIGDQDNVNVYE